MRVEFNRTGAERKALVTAIAEILGTKPKYMGMPTAAKAPVMPVCSHCTS